MRQYVPGGPQIPYELIEAHQKKELVFFCGAGISMYMQLPNFFDLVKMVHNRLFGGVMDQHLVEMCELGRLDQALHAMGRAINEDDHREGDRKVRREIISILNSYDKNAFPKTHEALLSLANTSNGHTNGHLLVTTNPDLLFHVAYEKSLQRDGDTSCSRLQRHAAPTLAVPHKGRWGQLTFLHGLIDEDADPYGEQLVFTSADFGRAYLRDGWAARFIVELFRDFTVIFVGYSLNDPVMTYLIDAITTVDGDSIHFKSPYAFVSAAGALSNEDKKRWRDRGVEPIEYSDANNHVALHATLYEWAESNRLGFDGMLQDALNITEVECQAIGDNSQRLHHLLWLLRQEYVAANFLAVKEDKGLPHVSWLIELHNKVESFPNITGRYPIYDVRSFLKAGETESNIDKEKRISDQRLLNVLSQWAATYIDNEAFCSFISNNGGKLCAETRWHIERALNDKLRKIDEVYVKYWRLVLSFKNKMNCNYEQSQWSRWTGRLKTEEICEKLSPCISISKRLSIRFHDEEELQDKRDISLFDMASFEIVARESGIWNDINYQRSEDPSFLSNEKLQKLAFPLSELLAEYQRLCEAAASYSLEDLSSISQHSQNSMLDDAQHLVLLCRDTFVSMRSQDRKQLASYWASLWTHEQLDIFGRLFLYAATEEKLPQALILKVLSAHKWDLLFDTGAYREVCRFLRKKIFYLPEVLKKKIIMAIDGKTLEVRYGRSDRAFEYAKDYKVGLFAKIASAGVSVPKTYKIDVERKNNQLSQEELEKHRDEFSTWHGEVKWGRHVSSKGWEKLSFHKITHEVVETIQQAKGGRELEDIWGKLGDLSQKHPAKALCVLICILNSADEIKDNPIDDFEEKIIWKVFESISVTEKKDELLEVLILSYEVYLEYNGSILDASYSYARLLTTVAENCSPNEIPEDIFWELWWLLRNQGKSHSSLVGDSEKPSTTGALNSVGGNLARSLLMMLDKLKLEKGSEFPNNYEECFDSLMGEGPLCQYARIMLARDLGFLHAIAPYWTVNRFKPFFVSTNSHYQEVLSAFFSAPRLNPGLWKDFREIFMKAFESGKECLVDGFGKNNLYNVFTDLLLIESYGISSADSKAIIAKADSDGLGNILWRIWWLLDNAKDKAGIQWKEGFEQIFYECWPKRLAPISADMLSSYVRLILATRDAFPDALRCFREIDLLPLGSNVDKEKIDSVIFELFSVASDRRKKEYNAAKEHPIEYFELLCDLLPDLNNIPIGIYRLKDLIEKLIEFEPELMIDERIMSFQRVL